MQLKIIGLTGGIASGKTTVLNEFKKLGVQTISCDEIAREVFYKKNISKKIKKLFSTLDRKEISKIIFSDTTKRNQLERILHPAVIKELKNQLKLFTLHPSPFTPAIKPSAGRLHPVIVDVPLLFETHLEKMFDKIIVVYCKKNQQISRLMKRDKITKAEAAKRLSAQMPLSKKIKFADIIIKNTYIPSSLSSLSSLDYTARNGIMICSGRNDSGAIGREKGEGRREKGEEKTKRQVER